MENLRIILIVFALVGIIALLISGLRANKKEKSTLFKKERSHVHEPSESADLDSAPEIKKTHFNLENDPVLQETQTPEPHIELETLNMNASSAVNSSSFEATSFETAPETEPKTFHFEAPVKIDEVISGAGYIHKTHSNIEIHEDHEPAKIQDKTLELDSEPKIFAADEFVGTETEIIDIKPDIHVEPILLQLYVRCPNNERMNGTRLLDKFSELNLKLDKNTEFFTFFDPHDQNRPLFEVCNMSETGSFSGLTTFTTEGVILFMNATSTKDESTLRIMSEMANKIAQPFGAHILDDELELFDLNAYHKYQNKIETLE